MTDNTLQEQGPAIQLSADEWQRLLQKALDQLSADGIEPLYFKAVGDPITREIYMPWMAGHRETQEKVDPDDIS